MCGYCTETIQLINLEREKKGKPVRELWEALIAGPYLQEAEDLLSALDKIRVAAYRKKVAPMQAMPSEALICRALDVLLTEGFDSPVYQKLLRSRIFQRAVDEACSSEKMTSLDLLPPEFRLKHLSCLYQLDFYLDPALSRDLTTFKTFGVIRHECLELLRAYIRGWVRKGVEMNHAAFTTAFRAIYASLALLGRFRSSKRLLWNIAEESPWSPDLEGYSLWLQHQAILQLHRREGFENIISRTAHLRASLFWYLDLKTGLTISQKELLKQHLLTLPRGDRVDNDFSLRKWLDEALD